MGWDVAQVSEAGIPMWLVLGNGSYLYSAPPSIVAQFSLIWSLECSRLFDVVVFSILPFVLGNVVKCSWSPSNPDTLGTIPSVLFSEVSRLNNTQKYY